MPRSSRVCHPRRHGAGHASVYTPLAQDGPATIAELLRDSGYWTIGFTAGGLMGRSNGLDRGFQWWTERIRANLHATLPGFFDAIGTAPTMPLFLLLHSYDIHGPYAYLPNAEEIHVGPRTGASQQATDTACEGPECRDRDAEWKRIRAIKHESINGSIASKASTRSWTPTIGASVSWTHSSMRSSIACARSASTIVRSS